MEATYLLSKNTTPIPDLPHSPGSYGYNKTAYSKLCEGAHAELSPSLHVRGLSELLFMPCLTIEQEWLQGKRWIDWKRTNFSAVEE